MEHRSDVSPSTLPVSVQDDRVSIEYQDGRVVEYPGPFERRDGEVQANRSLEVHVLVTDVDRSEGMMVYLNDYDTSDAILQGSGVGRVLLGDGQREVIYPGVDVERSGEAIVVTVDDAVSDVWVAVFVENELGERAYELAIPES